MGRPAVRVCPAFDADYSDQWAAVTNIPVVTNGQFVVTLSATTGNRFYALSFE